MLRVATRANQAATVRPCPIAGAAKGLSCSRRLGRRGVSVWLSCGSPEVAVALRREPRRRLRPRGLRTVLLFGVRARRAAPHHISSTGLRKLARGERGGIRIRRKGGGEGGFTRRRAPQGPRSPKGCGPTAVGTRPYVAETGPRLRLPSSGELSAQR